MKFLVSLSLAALSQARDVQDSSSLIQAALRRESPRNLTEAELAEVTAHLSGRHVSKEDVTDLLAEMWKGQKHALLMQKTRGHDWYWAEWTASKLCHAHFGAGLTMSACEDTVLKDLPYVESTWKAQATVRSFKRKVDVELKQVKVGVHGTWSRPWRLVSRRHGCVPAGSAWDWASAHLMQREDEEPSDTVELKQEVEEEDDTTASFDEEEEQETQQRGGEGADSESDESGGVGGFWKSVEGTAANLEQASWALQRFMNRVASEQKTAALLVAYGGKIYERYCKDCGINKHTKIAGYSLGKAMQGLLMGVRFHGNSHKGFGRQSSMPEIRSKANEWQLTIYNMQNMVAGIPPDEDKIRTSIGIADDGPKLAATTQTRKWYVFPGQFYYSTGYSHVAAREIRNSFDGDEKKYARYPWTALFNKANASSFMCSRDMGGTILFGSGCWARAKDWLKMGLLVLNRGKGPHGKQVVPMDFIDQLYNGWGTGINGHYIDGWYRLDRLYSWYYLGPVIAAQGVGGQELVVVPSQQLVVLRNTYTSVGDSSPMLIPASGAGPLRDFLFEIR